MGTKRKPNSSNSLNEAFLEEACVFNEVIRILSPQWKTQILFAIHWGFNRFSLLKKQYPSISDQILGKRIRELVTEDFICQIDNAESKKIVAYGLTRKGQELIKIAPVICNWGTKWIFQ